MAHTYHHGVRRGEVRPIRRPQVPRQTVRMELHAYAGVTR